MLRRKNKKGRAEGIGEDLQFDFAATVIGAMPSASHSFSRLRLPCYNAFPLTHHSSEDVFSNRTSGHFVKAIVNPSNDRVFQYGFNSPCALKGFLNSVLGFEGNKAIQNIEYLPRDLPSHDPTFSTRYHFTVDIRCRTANGQHFLIELQNDFRDDYHYKSLVEHLRMISQLDTIQNEGDKSRRVAKNKKDVNNFWKSIEGIYTVVITNKGYPLSRMKRFYKNEPIMEPVVANAYELRHVEQL